MNDLSPLSYAGPATPQFDENDLKFLWALIIGHWIISVLYIVASLPIVPYFLIGLAFLIGSPLNNPPNQSGNPGVFLTMCCGAFLFPFWAAAVLNVLSGWFIKRRRRRVFSFVIAGLNCINFPTGTTLGVFTFIVLSRRSVEELYRSTART